MNQINNTIDNYTLKTDFKLENYKLQNLHKYIITSAIGFILMIGGLLGYYVGCAHNLTYCVYVGTLPLIFLWAFSVIFLINCVLLMVIASKYQV